MIGDATIVDKLHSEFQELLAYLTKQREVSFLNSADANLRKALLLAAASYFERRLCDDILAFTKEVSSNNEQLTAFVNNKAIRRQYHTFFDWKSQNANDFWGLFGESFKVLMDMEVKREEHLNKAVRAFLEIGRERNRLVHENFGTFTMEKTTEDIYDLYKTALPFVQCIPDKLRSLEHGTETIPPSPSDSVTGPQEALPAA